MKRFPDIINVDTITDPGTTTQSNVGNAYGNSTATIGGCLVM